MMKKLPWIACGLVLGWAVQQLPFVNLRRSAAPVDQRPLIIRQDAKGDGRFGSPRSGNRAHRGVDIAAPLGSPVRALRSGRVITVTKHRGMGRYVELQHGGRMRSLYAHLDTIVVRPGDRVRQGQVIGTVGKTGNARHTWITPHVHLEVLRAGKPIDPAALGLALVVPDNKTTIAQADVED
jgi:murein DD-endopeptidase MepM/ murein hydrolase activator NlpD